MTGLLLRSLVKFLFLLFFEETPIYVVEVPRKENGKKKFDVVCFASFVAQKPELADKIEINTAGSKTYYILHQDKMPTTVKKCSEQVRLLTKTHNDIDIYLSRSRS